MAQMWQDPSATGTSCSDEQMQLPQSVIAACPESASIVSSVLQLLPKSIDSRVPASQCPCYHSAHYVRYARVKFIYDIQLDTLVNYS